MEQSYISAGCSEAGSTDEFDVNLKVIFFIFMLTTLIQSPDNTFHRKAFSNKYIHSVSVTNTFIQLMGKVVEQPSSVTPKILKTTIATINVVFLMYFQKSHAREISV